MLLVSCMLLNLLKSIYICIRTRSNDTPSLCYCVRPFSAIRVYVTEIYSFQLVSPHPCITSQVYVCMYVCFLYWNKKNIVENVVTNNYYFMRSQVYICVIEIMLVFVYGNTVTYTHICACM